mmetsp:Transcript_72573/g.187209  ORF Transcript_72573/g.187209 Transcript_72573/m.187209 type:complete len:124 (+) Transcript_72573:31-402(+)
MIRRNGRANPAVNHGPLRTIYENEQAQQDAERNARPHRPRPDRGLEADVAGVGGQVFVGRLTSLAEADEGEEAKARRSVFTKLAASWRWAASIVKGAVTKSSRGSKVKPELSYSCLPCSSPSA